jgi:cyclase
VWIPERSVLIAGDLVFNGGTPFVLMGSVEGTLRVLEEQIKPLGARTIVPGHGPVCGPEVVDDVLGYLRHVQAVAKQGFAAGLTPLEAAREIGLGEYADWTDSEPVRCLA